MNAAGIPSGWGFIPRRPRCEIRRGEFAAAAQVLNGAPDLLNLSPGLIARDLSTVLGIKYLTAYRVAQAMKHRPAARRSW